MSYHPLTFVVPLTPHLRGSATLSHCAEITPSLLLGSQEVVVGVGGVGCVCWGGGKRGWEHVTSLWTSAVENQLICCALSVYYSTPSFISSSVQSISCRIETCRIEEGLKKTNSPILEWPSGLYVCSGCIIYKAAGQDMWSAATHWQQLEWPSRGRRKRRKSCGGGVCTRGEKGISHSLCSKSLTCFLISLPITSCQLLLILSSGRCLHTICNKLFKGLSPTTVSLRPFDPEIDTLTLRNWWDECDSLPYYHV